MPYAVPMKIIRPVAAAAAAMLVLGACGSDSDDSSGSWNYTDDLGTKISLDKAPERIVVQSSMGAALSDLGVDEDKIVGYFGPATLADGSPDPQAEGLDTEGLTDVTGGGEYGDLDLEKLAELKPDLVVTSTYLEPDLWYVNDAAKEKVEKLGTPILAVSFDGKTLPELLDSTEKAAEALGADLKDDDVTEAHDEFTAQAEELKQLGATMTAEKKQIVAGSPSADIYYVSSPEANADLKYWKDELGLPIVQPDPDEQGYFEPLSWEQADKYPADVFLYDDRVGETGLQLFKDQPVFQTLNAAKNQAYVPWTSVAPPSYDAYADIFERLAEGLKKFS